MNKILRVLRQKRDTDFSFRKIARINRLSPTTVIRYWKIFVKQGYVLEQLEKLTNEELIRLFNPPRKRLLLIRQPDYAYVHRMLQRSDETLFRQWTVYRNDGPNDSGKPDRTLGFSQFCKKYREFAVKVDVVMRQPHKAGECVFVDFCGRKAPWTDPATGKQHLAEVFVAVMGCSSYTLFRAAPSQKLPYWIELHNWLYRTLGGVPCVTTPDNLRSAVTKAGREYVLNRTYSEQGDHFGSVIIPARPGEPRDKAPVENGVKCVRRWVLAAIADRTFFSIDEINQVFDELIPVINNKPFKKLPGSRQSWFEELDKPALKPLPSAPFEYAEWAASQKVPKDYHVSIKKHLYSVPSDLAGSHVEARATADTVDVFQGGKLVASHKRNDAIGKSTTSLEHLPPAHRFRAEQTPENFLIWAADIGPAVTATVRHQFDGKPVTLGLRACASLKILASDFGNDRLEAACRRAEALDSQTVKSIRSILQAGIDRQTEDDIPLMTPTPQHGNIRGSEYYARR